MFIAFGLKVSNLRLLVSEFHGVARHFKFRGIYDFTRSLLQNFSCCIFFSRGHVTLSESGVGGLNESEMTMVSHKR
jgi:hypothetical protein